MSKILTTLKENKIITSILILFSVVNILDAFTALFILKHETNPVFLLFNNIWIVIILKLALVGYVWYLFLRYKVPTNFYWFFFLSALIYGTLIIGFGVFSNLYVNAHQATDPIYQETISKIDMTKYYFKMIGIIYILPMLITNIVFWVYDKTKSNNVYQSTKNKITKEDLRR